jgi:lipopolysaccharide heptosyltransferase II
MSVTDPLDPRRADATPLQPLPWRTLPQRSHASQPNAHTLEPWGHDVRRILCVRTDHLGDVLMTTPALHALKTSAPTRHLTLLASPAAASVAPHLDDVDDVIVHNPPWSNRVTGHSLADERALIDTLAGGAFDAAVVFTVYSQSPLPAAQLCYLAGIPRRLARCRENPYALINEWVAETEPYDETRHEAQRQLSLVAAVGARCDDTRMRFAVAERDRVMLAQRLARARIGDARGVRPLVLIHPGASAQSRRYPAEHFARAAAYMFAESGCDIVLTGTAGELDLARRIARSIVDADPRATGRVHVLAGQLSLGEFAALLERAAVLVSNNSGPVHVASALGTPIVDLYALTNPQHTPWQTPHRVLYHDVECRWCYRSVCMQQHHLCLRGVEPEAVAQAALALLRTPRTEEPLPCTH